MKLDDLMLAVESSSPEDWENTTIHTTYRWEDRDGQGNPWQPNEHYHLAILKSDIDISLAWGARGSMPYSAPFGENFNHGIGSRNHVVLRYRGEPIKEWEFLDLDEMRHLIPSPTIIPGQPRGTEKVKYGIPRRMVPLGRLMSALASVEPFDDTLRQAELEIFDDER